MSFHLPQRSTVFPVATFVLLGLLTTSTLVAAPKQPNIVVIFVDRMPIAKGFHHFFGTLGANDNGKVTLYPDKVKQLTELAESFHWPEVIPDPGIN